MRLIDADALNKALHNNCDLCHDKNTNWCERCCPLNDFEDLIDNAPTVKPEKMLIANVNFDENKLKEIVQTEVINKIKSGELVLKDERPQDELAEKLKDRIEESICNYCPKIKNCVVCEISQVFQIIALTAEEQRGGAE